MKPITNSLLSEHSRVFQLIPLTLQSFHFSGTGHFNLFCFILLFWREGERARMEEEGQGETENLKQAQPIALRS